MRIYAYLNRCFHFLVYRFHVNIDYLKTKFNQTSIPFQTTGVILHPSHDIKGGLLEGELKMLSQGRRSRGSWGAMPPAPLSHGK